MAVAGPLKFPQRPPIDRNGSNCFPEDGMTDLVNLAMLVCAAIGSMAFGVLAAYGIFRVGFALMRPRPVATVTVKPQPEAAL